MTKPLRVLFVVPHPIEGPSSRFRVYQFVEDLHAAGVQVEVSPFITSAQTRVIYGPGALAAKVAATLQGALRRLLDILRAGRFDIVYVLREAFPFGPPWVERALRASAGRLVFDFDDAIYRPSLAYRNPLDRLRDFDKPRQLIRMAAHVVVGSEYLRQYALRHARRPDQVTVLPTVVDTDVYRPLRDTGRGAGRAAPAGNSITLGWIGTPRGSSYLRDLLDVIAGLVAVAPGLRCRFVGAEPFDTRGLPITFDRWRLQDEVADLQSFDIGLMPLTDDEETRGKCGFKLIQYMAVGIPAVCSPVGANLDIVQPGETGLLAATSQEWAESLRRLVLDPALRDRLGRRGRELAEQRYSRRTVAPRLLAVLHAVGRAAPAGAAA